MVAAEIAPYVSATETADAVASLGKALRQLGHNVTVLAPRQPGFESAGLLLARRLTPLPLPEGGEVHVLDAQLPSGVQLTLFDAPVLFDRAGVYGEGDQDYPDNARRFALLSQAAAALVRQREQQGKAFDVVHVHDAPAALTPLALSGTTGPSVPTVLTIHDARRPGSFSAEEAEEILRGRSEEARDLLWLDDRVNLLKAGIVTADTVTTVSPSYAAELSDEERSGSLARAIRESGKPIIGIVDGIDFATYNPATDGALHSRYDAEDATQKQICKGQILEALELDVDLERPLVACAAGTSQEEGFDLVLGALPMLLKTDARFVFAGEWPAAVSRRLKTARTRHRDSLGLIENADAAAIRRLNAAADLVIVPARHVPCGKAQLVAQRYGAAPVARAVGGHVDTVIDCDASLGTGTGFLFDEDTPDALVAAVRRGVAAFSTAAWPRLRRRVMRLDVGWDRPARRYLQVYRQTLASLPR